MTFDQWYGNRPANRKQVSREVWHAALAHASELVRLRAERDANHHLWERERDDHLMSRDKLLAERDGLRASTNEIVERLGKIWWLIDNIADQEITDLLEIVKQARQCRELVCELQMDLVLPDLPKGEAR